MAVWTEELDTSFSFPNIDVYKRFRDGEHVQYKVVPQEGYVIYNTTEEHWEQDSPESEPYLVTHYYTAAYLTPNYNFDNFPYVAVLRSEVDENYIYGGGDDNDHEIM